ncbi:MAG TPA: TerB family tellurite resistance protein [Oligoflexia bacterium]|nr:TerB family tellurite resistance protein [Oligoflexia bacterium]HMP48422.1 TerB family tellurite resistance protein [Oligoflexia bacterium]
MFEKIKGLFGKDISLSETSDGEAADERLLLGIGVLMLQMAGADNDYAPEEVQSCFRNLEKYFGVSDQEAMNILEKADSMRSDPENVSDLVQHLTDKYDEEQRQLILALVWKVVVADEQIQKYELKIANQLRVRLQLSEEDGEKAREMAFSNLV